jgi:hypothetical protein
VITEISTWPNEKKDDINKDIENNNFYDFNNPQLIDDQLFTSIQNAKEQIIIQVGLFL